MHAAAPNFRLGCTNRSLQLTTRLGCRRMPSLDACWPSRYPAGLCLHLMFAGRAPMYAHVTLPVTAAVVAKEVLELFQRETRVAGQVGLHLYQATRTHTAKAAQGVSTMPCTGLLRVLMRHVRQHVYGSFARAAYGSFARAAYGSFARAAPWIVGMDERGCL